jgi:hypothetical protein
MALPAALRVADGSRRQFRRRVPRTSKPH